MVEELMLLANELVAQWLGERKSPAVYRVHAQPDEEKLERLGTVAAKLGVEVDLESLREPGGPARWLAKVQKHPRRQVLEMLLLRSLMQATYDLKNIGHFGLASEAYVHFTSPIRRYPDILVHRAVKYLLRGGKPKTTPAALEQLAESAQLGSERERAAMEIEREIVDLYRALLMRDRIGDVCEGTVTGVVGSGAFVALDDPFVEVLVKFESMGPDHYQLSDDELSIVGSRSGDTISLGDRMVVVIEDVAVLRRSVYGKRVVPEAVLQKLTEPALDKGERGARAGAALQRPRRFGGRPERPQSGPPSRHPASPAARKSSGGGRSAGGGGGARPSSGGGGGGARGGQASGGGKRGRRK
jgi:ribonuclease R